MSDVNQKQVLRTMMRLAAAGAAAAVLAGCSSDASRLAEGPFSQSDRTPTASIGGSYGGNTLMPPDSVSSGGAASAQPAPNNWSSAAVQSQPLAAPGPVMSSPLPAPTNMASSMPTRPSYGSSPITTSAPRAVTAAAAAPASGGASFGPWSASGGTAVTVAQGDSASVLAARYGVPQEALLKVNGLSSAAQVTPGARLTIPVYNANAPRTASAPAAAATPATRPMASNAAATRDARAPRSLNTQAAAIRPGAKPAVAAAPAAQAAAKPKPEPAKKAEIVKPAEKKVAEKKAPEKVAKVEERKPALEERRQVAAAPAAAEPAPVAEKPAADKPEFRWPARGRIIQGFKSGANEGINIAVPEGTQVKAAESGVVAYAGSELKGYGNLVLIRHPNGYVSAYAHNGEVSVKRGENVKRGQTIAKSGQSGNVASPQLHFELRKGSTPVDPTSYLAGL